MEPRRWIRALIWLSFLLVPAIGTIAADHQTALDTYVHTPDSHYQYRLVKREPHEGYTTYLIRMTSQQWRSPAEVNQCVWKHWMRLYIPDSVSSSTGMLYILNGSIRDKGPESVEERAALAIMTQSIISEVYQVPNQPLIFKNDSFGPRIEDEIIAYTWRKFLDGGDSNWPLRLPMTKAAVRAMDTVSSFAASKEGGRNRVDHFVVTGQSKRGWTTWTTAAVDPRVVAIAPQVLDVLNFVQSVHHHFRSYGFWAPAAKSYYDEHLLDDMNSDAYRRLMEIEDPYSYRDRFTMPKLIVNASSDQFFPADSSQFYFDDLPGEKHLLYEANTNHSLRGTDSWQSIGAFYESVLLGGKRPNLQSAFEADGSIKVTVDQTPLTVTLWQATNPNHRDFRLEAIGSAYHSSSLTAASPGVYVARVPRPAKGWTAFFVEATFASGGRFPFKFTTQVRILPEGDPYSLPEKGKTKLQEVKDAAHY